MAVIYELRERRVIPNWRDFKRTLQLGELRPSNKSFTPKQFNINRSVDDWKQLKSVGTAADIINSAFVSGMSDAIEVQEAMDFLLSKEVGSSESLLGLITQINSRNSILNTKDNNSLLEMDIDTIDEFKNFIDNEHFYSAINRLKKRSKNELYNPIVWIELARLYSMNGQMIKAQKAILTSLHLAPNNRFVLRSATRFFAHNKLYDKALYYLRKSEGLRSDPWLISAHIATSSIIGKYSPFVKDGLKLVNSNNYSDFELTELSSSIGTLEFKNGALKKAKTLFDKSMLSPNDNSLAQLEWISKHDSRFNFNPLNFNNVVNPFEAHAIEFFQRGQWKDAFYNTIKWFIDMPYSKRPVLLGSYIASSLIGDKYAAIMLCEASLKANPNEPILLNNLVFSIATSSEVNFDKLDKYFKKMLEVDIDSLSNEQKITYQATIGLVALKRGNTKMGLYFYKLAIENASIIKNDYLKNLAIANLTRELITLNLPEKEYYINIVKNMKIIDSQCDLKLLKNKILELL